MSVYRLHIVGREIFQSVHKLEINISNRYPKKENDCIKVFDVKLHKKLDVAMDPTRINIGRLKRTEPNLIHFK